MGGGGGNEERMEILAVIFTVASDAETAGLDGWETETDGLAEGSGVDVGDVVVVTDTTIGEIEALPWDISVWVGGVICGEPGDGHEKSKKKARRGGNAPSLDKDLFGTIGGTGGGSETNVGSKLIEGMVRRDGHTAKGRGSMGSIGVDGGKIHSNIVCIVGGGVDRVRVAEVR